MDDNQPAESATICFVYDEYFRSALIDENSPEVWITTRISIGGTPLWNFEYDVDGLAAGIVFTLLQSTIRAIENERYYLTFEDGPSYLVIEPRDENSVRIAYCLRKQSIENPDDRREIETELPVTKRAWANAVIDTANEFRQEVLNVDPGFRSNRAMVDVTEKLAETEALVAQQLAGGN